MENPRYPVPAVAALIRKEEHVLLIKRGVEPSQGKWSLPGGKIELGEELQEALRREMKEELQVEVRVHDISKVKDYIERDQQGQVKWHYILIDFNCEIISGTPTATSDATQVRWVSPHELIYLSLTETTREVLEDLNIIP